MPSITNPLTQSPLLSLSLNKLLLTISLLTCINCQSSSGRIFGIGVGTFIIILAIVFSVLWCLLCRSSSNPEVYSILGLVVPVILIIIFIFMPKQVNRPATTAITDSNFIPHIVFMVISIVGLVLGLVFIMINEVFVFRKAKNVARAAFIMKEQQQDKLNNDKMNNNNNGQGMDEVESKSNNQISMGESRKDSQTYIKERPIK